MKPTNNRLSEKEMELARMLMSECKTTSDVQEKLKRLFAGTIEQMLEAEMDEHLGYEKNSVLGNRRHCLQLPQRQQDCKQMCILRTRHQHGRSERNTRHMDIRE